MSAKIKAEYMYFVKGTLFWPNQKIWQSRQLHFLVDLSTTLFDLPSLQKFSAISYFMILLHQQKGELHTSDYGDDKSTKIFQPHSINSELFWRIVCTQNDSNSRVYGYNYLTYYDGFFMNCLAYATILTAFYKGRSILATCIHPQRFQLACLLL